VINPHNILQTWVIKRGIWSIKIKNPQRNNTNITICDEKIDDHRNVHTAAIQEALDMQMEYLLT
jgi:hypothetical protein